MYANVYGYEGVKRAIRLLKNEIVQDGWNLGISSLDDLNPSLVRSNATPPLVFVNADVFAAAEPQESGGERSPCLLLDGDKGRMCRIVSLNLIYDR